MRKNLLAVVFVFVVLFFSVNAKAENDVRLSDDLRGLIGKVVIFQDGFPPNNTYICSITGISEYRTSMGRTVVISISRLDFHGEEIDKLMYDQSYPSSNNGWTLERNGGTVKINVTKIE